MRRKERPWTGNGQEGIKCVIKKKGKKSLENIGKRAFSTYSNIPLPFSPQASRNINKNKVSRDFFEKLKKKKKWKKN